MSDDTPSGMNPALKIILGVAAGLLFLFCLGGGMLFFIVKGSVDAYERNAAVHSTQVQMEQLKNAVEAYRLENRMLPDSLDQLVGPTGFLVADEVPADAWGHPFSYEPDEDGRTFTIRSLGADGAEGGADDAADLAVTNARTQ